ncbi:MAG: M56 family peptidase, partial [Flavobacteriia bacterium]
MEYFIKSSAILIIFYVSYKLLLQKETFFQSIRFYLLTGIFASLILPLIIIPEYVTIEAVNLPIGITPIKAIPSTPEPTLTWQQVLTIIYLTGMAFFFIRFLFRLVSVIHFISSHKKNRSGKFYLIKTQKNISPFSFFNFIVFNDANYSENELEQILNHEKVHVKQFHSFDILLSQIITIIFWFNPFSWLYSKEIRKNLEFIADEDAQNFVKEKKNYQYLLLKTSSPEIKLVLTSNFYNSLIKKRIDMLQKERSKKFMQLKFTLILPILIAFIFTFNTKIIAQKKEGYTIEIFTDRVDIYEFITKDTKDDELKKIKKEFEENGTQFKYKRLKRNNKGEITGISITVKNKAGNEAKISQNSNQPISPIM